MAKAVPIAAGIGLSAAAADMAKGGGTSQSTNAVNPWAPTAPYLSGGVNDLARIYLGNQGGGYGVGGGGYYAPPTNAGSGTPGLGGGYGPSSVPSPGSVGVAANPMLPSIAALPGVGGKASTGANSVLSAYGAGGTPMKTVSTFVPTMSTNTGGAGSSGGSFRTTQVVDQDAVNQANQMATMFQNMSGAGGYGGQGGGGGMQGMYGPAGYQPFGMGGVWDTANNEYMKTLQGNYLDKGNPYLQSVIDRAMGDVASRFEGSSRYGSGANADAMMNAAGQIRYQDYAQERANQLAAMGNAPAWAQTPYQLNAAQIAAPYENIKQYLGLLSPLGAGLPTNTASSPYYTNPLGSALGAASTGVGLYSQARNAGLFGGGATGGAGAASGAAMGAGLGGYGTGMGSAAGAAAGAGGKAASSGGKGAAGALSTMA